MKKDTEMNGDRQTSQFYTQNHYSQVNNNRRLTYQGEPQGRDLGVQSEVDMQTTIKSIINNKLQSFDTEQLLARLARTEEENFSLKRRAKFLEGRIKFLEDEKRARYAGVSCEDPRTPGIPCITRANVDHLNTSSNARFVSPSGNLMFPHSHSNSTYTHNLNRVRSAMSVGLPYPPHDLRDLMNGNPSQSNLTVPSSSNMHQEIVMKSAENFYDPHYDPRLQQSTFKQNVKIFAKDETHVELKNETHLSKEHLKGIPFFPDNYPANAKADVSETTCEIIIPDSPKEDSNNTKYDDSSCDIRNPKGKKKTENIPPLTNGYNSSRLSPRGGKVEAIKYPKVSVKSSGVKSPTPDSADQLNRYQGNANNNSLTPTSSMYRGINPGSDAVEYKPLSKPSTTSPSITESDPPLPYPVSHSNNVIPQQPPPLQQSQQPLHAPPTYANAYALQVPLPQLIAHITSDKSSIILTWDIVNNSHQYQKNVDAYFLYAFHTLDLNHAPPNDISFWKRISVIKPLPLPIACTLTQSFDGHNYFFAVASVDRMGRVGELSNPCALKVAL